MTIKILLERKFKQEPGLEDIKIINALRTGAMERRGYVSGETLVDMNDHCRMVVVSVWSNKAAWDAWENSKERSKLEAGISDKLKQRPIIRAFMPGADYLGGVFDEVVHDSEVK